LCEKPTQINNQSRKIISNFKSDPESIKIPSSNPELASILKSDHEPMILSQITNTKILSLNKSKPKQFLSLKDEQLNKSSQWNNLKEKIKKNRHEKISKNKKSSQ
jgi:CRISPR/Cas system-associated endonuclease Cas3-HD